MSAPLTDRVRKAMQLAEGHRRVASCGSCGHISTEHVLLGLIGAGGVASDALARLGVTKDKIKAAVAEELADFESVFAKLVTGPTPTPTLYASLHTSMPAGNQTNNEVAYPGYKRVAIPNVRIGHRPFVDILGGSVEVFENAEAIDFPACTGAKEIVVSAGIGVAPSGGGKLIFSGHLHSPFVVTAGLSMHFKPGALCWGKAVSCEDEDS